MSVQQGDTKIAPLAPCKNDANERVDVRNAPLRTNRPTPGEANIPVYLETYDGH